MERAAGVCDSFGLSQQLHLRRHWFLLYENDANLFIFAKLLFVNLAIHGGCFRIINKFRGLMRLFSKFSPHPDWTTDVT